MMMTIYDMLEMFCFAEDVIFSVYDLNEDVQDYIFEKGYRDDCPEEVLDMMICNIDNIYPDTKDSHVIVFNVESLNDDVWEI